METRSDSPDNPDPSVEQFPLVNPATSEEKKPTQSSKPIGESNKKREWVRSKFSGLTIAALGVVFGDIGTSPLYAFRECFRMESGISPSEDNVLGILSLITWSLIVVVSIKYLVFIMRADHSGEGGIFALFSLIPTSRKQISPRVLQIVTYSAIFGAALLYGDGIITPSISVLSAIEGLEVITPAAENWVVPATVVILILLFSVQKYGTGKVGGVFGPIMLCWFLFLAVSGLMQIVTNLVVFKALWPGYALAFFANNGVASFLVLGAVFLTVTGGEALYADMGHFGRSPIRKAWFFVVLPALLLNYYGQGALLLNYPADIFNPFYEMIGSQWRVPVVLLATIATVIASQALITGAYSLTWQAVQLGYLPRLRILHTSREQMGQIYVPSVNWGLMVACVVLVIGFKRSGELAAAYGLAVTVTMVITTFLFYFVASRIWRWDRWKIVALLILFLTFDLSFFGANVFKLFSGGWVPVAVAGAVMLVMTTWKRGRDTISGFATSAVLPFEDLLRDIRKRDVHRVPGTALFMTYLTSGVPRVLLHHLLHNQALHETVVLFSVQNVLRPVVSASKRVTVENLEEGFYRVRAYYGFFESPDVLEVMRLAQGYGLITDPARTTYYLGRQSLVLTDRGSMPLWRKRLFSFLSRNSLQPGQFFNLPPRRVIELGVQVEL